MHREFDVADTPRGHRLHVLDLVLTRLLYFVTAVLLFLNIVFLVTTHSGTTKILQRINDCTTPGHACYEDGKTRTAGVVKNLEHIIILANYCSGKRENDTVEKLNACVTRLLQP